MKQVVLLFCALLSTTSLFAEDLVLLRTDQKESSYYEPHTIRRTGPYVMVWVVTRVDRQKNSEYLLEFNCEKAVYRQLSLRVFASESQVVSGNVVYKQWFNVPRVSQVLGLLFKEVCVASSR